jgi:hypothetical protein
MGGKLTGQGVLDMWAGEASESSFLFRMCRRMLNTRRGLGKRGWFQKHHRAL